MLAGLLLLLIVVRIHAVSHAGALWRDEVHSLELAKDPAQPAWLDSFPSLWIWIVRAVLVPAGDLSDFQCRLFGFIAGLLVVAAAWWAPRVQGATGWVCLALLCLHPVVIVFGGEFRAYGLAMACQLLLFGVMARIAIGTPARKHWIALPIASLLAVHISYTNSFMLLAVSAGAGIVLLTQRRWRALAGIGASGLVAAATMIPYALYVVPHVSSVAIVVRGEYSQWFYAGKFATALGAAGVAGVVWVVLPVALVLICVVRLVRGRADARLDASRREVLFALTTLLVGTIGFFAYLHFLSILTQVWYYMPLMTLWAFCCDVMLGALGVPTGRAARIRLAVVVGVIAVPLVAVWANTGVRLTNVDLAARIVNGRAQPGDLVVVIPWYVGLSFARYYDGKAARMNFPDIQRGKWQEDRDLLERMKQERPIDADLRRMEETLRTGGRIWLVGRLPTLKEGEVPGELPPAPHSPYGWNADAYTTIWHRNAAYTLKRRATSVEAIDVPLPWPVQHLELVSVSSFAGWRE